VLTVNVTLGFCVTSLITCCTNADRVLTFRRSSRMAASGHREGKAGAGNAGA